MLRYSSWLSAPGRVGGIVSCMNDRNSRVVRRPQASMNSEPASGAASPLPLRSGEVTARAVRLVGRASRGGLRRRERTARRLLPGEHDEPDRPDGCDGQTKSESKSAHSVSPSSLPSALCPLPFPALLQNPSPQVPVGRLLARDLQIQAAFAKAFHLIRRQRHRTGHRAANRFRHDQLRDGHAANASRDAAVQRRGGRGRLEAVERARDRQAWRPSAWPWQSPIRPPSPASRRPSERWSGAL